MRKTFGRIFYESQNLAGACLRLWEGKKQRFFLGNSQMFLTFAAIF